MEVFPRHSIQACTLPCLLPPLLPMERQGSRTSIMDNLRRRRLPYLLHRMRSIVWRGMFPMVLAVL